MWLKAVFLFARPWHSLYQGTMQQMRTKSTADDFLTCPSRVKSTADDFLTCPAHRVVKRYMAEGRGKASAPS